MIKNFKVLLVYPNLTMVNLLPTNISILSAYLKDKGFQVSLFDTTLYRNSRKTQDEIRAEYLQVREVDLSKYGVFYKDTNVFDDFKKKVKEYQPDLIAVNAVEDTYKLGVLLLKCVEKFNIPNIMGGIYPTFSPEEVIKEDCIDMICIGEGEEALVELCEKMAKNEDYSLVKNIWVKHNDKIIKNSLRPLIDLNTLLYADFSIFEKERFYRPMQGKIFKMVPIEIDRGCLYNCSFCAAPTLRKFYRKLELGNYFRKKRIEKVINEVLYHKEKYGADYIYFNCETFLSMTEDELYEFSKLYRKIGLPFWCQTRIETITEKKIKLLEEMNCNRMSIGLEHGNEEFRKKLLNKHFLNEDVLKAFNILKKSSIPVTVNNMIGFPDETRELVFDTINLNRRINADSISVYIFTPYRGIPLREVCLKKGYIDNHSSTATLIYDTVLNMPQLSREEILGLMRTFCLYVKLPESEFYKIRLAEKADEKGNKMFQELRNIYYKQYF